MNTTVLRKIGLSENEVKLYLALIKSGALTAYELSQKTGIYRVHVYDKLEQLQKKGFATHIYMGAKKHFKAASPIRITQFLEEKKSELSALEKETKQLIPELSALEQHLEGETKVDVFKGVEGLKFFLRDILKTKKEVMVTGIDDQKYMESLPVFMGQYFRDLRLHKIKERVITVNRKSISRFNKKMAATTTYRFLDANQFNPTNTFIYGEKVVIVSWDVPVTAIMIHNIKIAETYKNHFEYLWKIAKKKLSV
jgi:sugar-specific transcriptional regulator TrmB